MELKSRTGLTWPRTRPHSSGSRTRTSLCPRFPGTEGIPDFPMSQCNGARDATLAAAGCLASQAGSGSKPILSLFWKIQKCDTAQAQVFWKQLSPLIAYSHLPPRLHNGPPSIYSLLQPPSKSLTSFYPKTVEQRQSEWDITYFYPISSRKDSK